MENDTNTAKQPVMYGQTKPKEQTVSQKAAEEITSEKKNPILRVFLKFFAVLAVIVILVLAYLFLLMGEPEEEQKNMPTITEAKVQGPITPMEGVGEGSLEALPSAFEDSVMYLTQGAVLEKSRISDTASDGGYARVVALNYVLPSGVIIEVKSIRPVSATNLLKQGDEYTLDGTKMYSLAGMNAGKMSNGKQSVIFAQSDTALYAVVFPESAKEEVTALLRATALLSPQAE